MINLMLMSLSLLPTHVDCLYSKFENDSRDVVIYRIKKGVHSEIARIGLPTFQEMHFTWEELKPLSLLFATDFERKRIAVLVITFNSFVDFVPRGECVVHTIGLDGSRLATTFGTWGKVSGGVSQHPQGVTFNRHGIGIPVVRYDRNSFVTLGSKGPEYRSVCDLTLTAQQEVKLITNRTPENLILPHTPTFVTMSRLLFSTKGAIPDQQDVIGRSPTIRVNKDSDVIRARWGDRVLERAAKPTELPTGIGPYPYVYIAAFTGSSSSINLGKDTWNTFLLNMRTGERFYVNDGQFTVDITTP